MLKVVKKRQKADHYIHHRREQQLSNVVSGTSKTVQDFRPSSTQQPWMTFAIPSSVVHAGDESSQLMRL
jgi:hypothetical protein